MEGVLPKPGDTVDRFVLEALVGQGGMGAVYRARDPKLQRRVALKVLRAEVTGGTGSTSSEGTARLLREARAAASLDHPNAVAIYDVGEHDGQPYIAMELVEGKSLRALVGDAGVPAGERLRVLVDVARALAAAHKRGLVHRDVKPENVMIRDDGVVKVLDFGIARRHAAPTDPHGSTTPEGLATITQEGAVLGTPLYMAPEQIRGDALDGRADQFAWGVMAYELLTGKVPWVFERDAFRLVAAILTSTPEPLGPRAPDVPGAVASAVERAIAKEPSSRFPTMDHLVAAVEAATTSPAALARTEAMTRSDVTPRRERGSPGVERPSGGLWPLSWAPGSSLPVRRGFAQRRRVPTLLSATERSSRSRTQRCGHRSPRARRARAPRRWCRGAKRCRRSGTARRRCGSSTCAGPWQRIPPSPRHT